LDASGTLLPGWTRIAFRSGCANGQIKLRSAASAIVITVMAIADYFQPVGPG
jgi:hypothetical protein